MCVSAIATLAGTAIQAGAASSAARSQARAGREQLDLQREVYEDQQSRFEPYEAAGRRGLEAYSYELGLGDAPEGYEGIQESPGFQTQLDMGRESVEAGAAGRGGLYSGATVTSLERYRTGLASQEVGNYLNRLASLGAQGQGAAGMQGQAGQNYATGASNALANIGNARAAGAMGVGNALSGGLNNMMGIYGYGQNVDPNLRTFGGTGQPQTTGSSAIQQASNQSGVGSNINWGGFL